MKILISILSLRKIIYFLLASILMSPNVARSDIYYMPMLRGSDLVEQCIKRYEFDDFSKGMCHGYIDGVRDMISSLANVNIISMPYCLSQKNRAELSVNRTELRESVISYLNRNPDKLYQTGADTILAAFVKLYPCPSE